MYKSNVCKGMYRAALALALSAAPGLALAQSVAEDDIVVTATRASDGVPRDRLGGAVTLFSVEDLEARQVTSVADLLRDAPGVEVSRNGVLGGLTQVRIRGSEANHILVLIDGIDASDVVQGEFDFATLIADDVARVEVLRGAQSALYGSDAIAGVVHYITASGRDEPGARARFEYGSFNTGQLSARIAGASGAFDWALSGNVLDSDGTPGAPGGSRDLAYEGTSLAGRFGWTVSDDLSLSAVIRARETRADFNEDVDFDAIYDDTPGIYYEDEAIYGLVRADLSTFNDAWTHALVVQRAEGQRATYSSFPGVDEGERNKASYITTRRFGSDAFDQNLTGAIDYRDETFRTSNIVGDRSIDQTGVALEYNALIGGRFGLGLAARHDDNSRFEGATTYRVQGSYAFDTGTRLRGAIGSGIKNPTMFELFGFFGDFVGNADLQPEESDGWELGVEQYLFDRTVLVGVTYFESQLENEIGSETVMGVTRPINRPGTSDREGVEVFMQARFGEQWDIDLSYTYLEADEPVSGGGRRPERRRAENIASANVNWRTSDDRAGLNLNVRYNGEQIDDSFATFPAMPVTLDAFTLVTLGGDWRLSEALQVYGRVENALDEDYTEVFGYASPERAYYVGLRAGF
jgi:vitamin B12 transporter